MDPSKETYEVVLLGLLFTEPQFTSSRNSVQNNSKKYLYKRQ